MPYLLCISRLPPGVRAGLTEQTAELRLRQQGEVPDYGQGQDDGFQDRRLLCNVSILVCRIISITVITNDLCRVNLT